MRIFTLSLFFLAAMCGVQRLSAQDCDHPDFAPLMAFYESTNGDDWTDNTGWPDGTAATSCDPCNSVMPWRGVSCNASGRVTRLYFYNSNLSGQIPPEIGALSEVQVLMFRLNNLEGPIPQELGNLVNMKRLYLEYNNLTGSIPPSLANLSQLTLIGLTNNQLSGTIPPELGNLVNLESLSFGSNNLTGTIPSSFANLGLLTFFQLSNNELTGPIPSWISSFSRLDFLNLGNNQLTGTIPENIATLPLLRFFQISGNQVEGTIPSEFTENLTLSYFSVGDNNLTGEIPSGFGDLPQLSSFLASNNNLSGCVPEDLLTHCQGNFSLRNNPLLPWQGNRNSFCSEAPQIGAPCDDGIPGNGPDVINEDCSCGDYVPPVVCDHPDYAALEAFYESTNGDEWDNNTGWLTDCEPCQWQGVTCTNGRVTRLILPNNNLNGPLPAEMAALTFLGDVYLLHNKLSGSLPGFFAGNSSLRFLRIGFNEFSGEIPAGLAQIPNLRWLDLQSNNLTGELPAAFGELADLQMLSVRNNQITGTIPVSFAQLDGLTWLDLRSNNLSGCLDEALLALCGGPNVSLGGNPLLPWSGDFHNFCAGFDQVSASCDDGNPQTTNDEIGADCLCAGGTGLAGCADRVGKPCDDGDPKTEGETIQQDCSCGFDGKKSFTGSSRLSNPPLVYPNPTSGIALTVSLPASGMQLRLLSATGREVSRQIALGYITQISVHDLEPGLYLLEIQNQEEHWVRKIIIQ